MIDDFIAMKSAEDMFGPGYTFANGKVLSPCFTMPSGEEVTPRARGKRERGGVLLSAWCAARECVGREKGGKQERRKQQRKKVEKAEMEEKAEIRPVRYVLLLPLGWDWPAPGTRATEGGGEGV